MIDPDDFLRRMYPGITDTELARKRYRHFTKPGIRRIKKMGKIAGWDDEDIRELLHQPISAATWSAEAYRSSGDLVANWIHKEIRRVGDSKRNSDRRIALLDSRKKLRTSENFKKLYDSAPTFCTYTGHRINYGLGLAKKLVDDYLIATTGLAGISPSLDRIDPELDYDINNVRIISAATNKLINDGVYIHPRYSKHLNIR